MKKLFVLLAGILLLAGCSNARIKSGTYYAGGDELAACITFDTEKGEWHASGGVLFSAVDYGKYEIKGKTLTAKDDGGCVIELKVISENELKVTSVTHGGDNGFPDWFDEKPTLKFGKAN